MGRSDSGRNLAVVALGATATFLLLNVDAVRQAWELTLWKLFVYGVGSFIILSLLIISVNILIAARTIRGLESEEEIERIMVPVLQAESSLLGDRSRRVFRSAGLLWAGVMMGAVLALIVRNFEFW